MNMKILLMPNLEKPAVFSCVKEVCKILSPKAELWMTDQKQGFFTGCPEIRFGDFNEMLKGCDLCMAVGGDGTIIHTAKHAAQQNKPVLGINLGRLGFLATLETSQLELLYTLEKGQYALEERMMLQIIHSGKKGETSYFALNDAVISKGALARMIDLDIYCEEKPVGSYRADGVILSTPTGSTAYNLSAGGPVIDPTIDCITLTPISPHSPFSRTIIFHDQSTILLRSSRENQEIFLTVDGEQSVAVEIGDKITVKKSKINVKLINLTGKLFYQVLNDKLLYGTPLQNKQEI